MNFVFASIPCFSQEASNSGEDKSSEVSETKGFHLGLFVGALIPNDYTASLYNGYGFDVDGIKYDFQNSWMNQKIYYQYGGNAYSGQVDQISPALGVPDKTYWSFSENDMPVNMRYSTAFSVGLNVKYSVDYRNSIILNVNAAQLTINGNFTIVTIPPTGSTQINNSIQTFGIVGGEQRLILQFGYTRLLGDNEKAKFLIEGGLNATIAKFNKNQIQINNLSIDLTENYNSTYYNAGYIIKKPVGIGFGVFAGLGVNLTMSPKWTVQLIYQPSYEKINIGSDPAYKFQHSIGLRAYMMLKKLKNI